VAASLRVRSTLPVVVVLALLGLWAVLPLPAASQSESELRQRIERGRERERALSNAVAELDRLLTRVRREVAIIQGRLNEVQADLVAAEARLANTREQLVAERLRLSRLRRRLAEDRVTLAAQLVASYKADNPDVVSLVLGAHDFAELIERVQFVRRVEERNAIVVDRVRRWRNDAHRQSQLLARLEAKLQRETEEIERRRDALASMRAGLAERQSTLERVRAARAQALAGTRAGRQAAERALNRLIAARERAAAAASPGPGGPWAIPWPIVQCESGGQNLPPNSAGASGYYQMLPSTWRGLGGSTPHAYQASKAEQDRLAAQLWAGGSGARNWVCAGLVG
jgi:peptidoglycan hydrolase CwlO-like protein